MNGVSAEARTPAFAHSQGRMGGGRRSFRGMVGIALFIVLIWLVFVHTPVSLAQVPGSFGRGAASGPVPRQPSQPRRTRDYADTGKRIGEDLVDVLVEGNTTIPTSAILPKITTLAGRAPTQAQIRKDIAALYDTGWFERVEPIFRKTRQGLVLVFRVREHPTLRRVEFRGNDDIDDDRLEAITGLKPGGAYNVSANRRSARRIEQEYRERGYPFAKVKLLKGDSPDDREVIFQIDEGKKTLVTGVKFTGNEFFSDSLLKTKLQTKRALLWTFGGKFDPKSPEADVAAIKNYYESLGFFNVDVQYKVEIKDSRFNIARLGESNAILHFKINEGPRYRIRSIEVNGNRVIPDHELRKDFELEAGQYFNARQLDADVEGMTAKYGELGRMFASVDARPRFLDKNGLVDIIYDIDEDQVRRIRKVNVHIHGENPHTRETVALNRLWIQPGDLANPRLIQRSERALLSAGVFESTPGREPQIRVSRVKTERPRFPVAARGQSVEELEPPPGRPENPTYQPGSPMYAPEDLSVPDDPAYDPANPQFDPNSPAFNSDPQGNPFPDALHGPPPGWVAPPQVDIDIDAWEARTGRLMFGVGVNSDAGLVGSFVLQEDNFDILRPPTSWRDIADGTAWRGRAQKFRLEAVPGSDVSRYLMSWSDPYFLDTNFSLSTSGFFFNRFYRDWTEDRLGGRIGLGRMIDRRWSITGVFRLADVRIKNPKVPTPPILGSVVGHNFLSTFRADVTYDDRDTAFIPTEGFYAQFGYEQAFGDFQYPRFDLDLRQYWTVHRRPDDRGRHVLSFLGNLAWTGDGTPIFERLYAGGFQSFRGFSFRGVSPKVANVQTGGQWLAIGSLEYKVPLTAAENIQAVVFSDFGTVENEIQFDDVRVAVGAGLRLTVPAMGPVPIALDWTVPVKKRDFDDTQVFSFYIGINR